MNEQKTKIIYCKDSNRRRKMKTEVKFDFLGYTFIPREAQNQFRKESFTNFLPGVSMKTMTAMNEKLNNMPILRIPGIQIEAVAKELNPVLQGWINYYGKFYKTKLKSFLRGINANWPTGQYESTRRFGSV